MMLSGYCQLQKSTFMLAIASLEFMGRWKCEQFFISLFCLLLPTVLLFNFEACERAFEFSFDICTNTSRGLQQTVDS